MDEFKSKYNDICVNQGQALASREIKQTVLSKLSTIERSCINEDELENYLLIINNKDWNKNRSRNIEANNDDNDNVTVNDIITFIRSRLNFWIRKSEIYLLLSSKSQLEENEYEKRYINKELYAIYNYIHLNSIKDDDNSFEQIRNRLTESKEHILLNDILNRESIIPDSQYTKSIYSFNLLRLIYSYVIHNHSFSDNITKLKVQNLIIFFIGNNDWYYIQSKNQTNQTFCQCTNASQYFLRKAKKNDDTVINKQKAIEAQMQMNLNKDKLNMILNEEPIKSFMSFSHIDSINYSDIINASLLRNGNCVHSEEANNSFILSAYTLLANVLMLGQNYLEGKFNMRPIELSQSNEFLIEQSRQTLSLSKALYKKDSSYLNDLIVFYCNVIEQNKEYEMHLRLQVKEMPLEKKIDDVLIIDACDSYMNEYYNSNKAIQLRERTREYCINNKKNKNKTEKKRDAVLKTVRSRKIRLNNKL